MQRVGVRTSQQDVEGMLTWEVESGPGAVLGQNLRDFIVWGAFPKTSIFEMICPGLLPDLGQVDFTLRSSMKTFIHRKMQTTHLNEPLYARVFCFSFYYLFIYLLLFPFFKKKVNTLSCP